MTGDTTIKILAAVSDGATHVDVLQTNKNGTVRIIGKASCRNTKDGGVMHGSLRATIQKALDIATDAIIEDLVA